VSRHHATPRPDDPWEVSTGASVAFVVESLGGPCRLVDVGAGQGRIAAALVACGFRVTAVEPDPEAGALARARGVDVLELDAVTAAPLPGPFDAALFGRSLHHVADPRRALGFARASIAPGAPILLDEFCWDRADEATATWFFARWDRAEAEGRLEAREDAPGRGEGALARWRAAFLHDPPLLTGKEMLAALGGVATSPSPGLYRFFEQRSLSPDAAWIRALLEDEQRAIARGEVRPVGLRAIVRQAGGGASASGSVAPST